MKYHSCAVIRPCNEKLLSRAYCHALDHTDLSANFSQVDMRLGVKDLHILAVRSCIAYIQGEGTYIVNLPLSYR